MRIKIQPEEGETFDEVMYEHVHEMALVGRRGNAVGAMPMFSHLLRGVSSASIPDQIGQLRAVILRLEREYMQGSLAMEKEIRRQQEERMKAGSVSDGSDVPTT